MGKPKVKVKHKTNSLILIYKLTRQDQINAEYMKILNSTPCDMLLPVELHTGITGRSVHVKVENCMDITSYVKSNISFGDFLQLVRRIIDVVRECESLGLRSSNLELNLEYTFCTDRGIPRLVYRPLVVLDEYADLPGFLFQLGQIASFKNAEQFKEKYLKLLEHRDSFETFWFREDIDVLEAQWKSSIRRSGSLQHPVETHSLADSSQGDLTQSFFSYLIRLNTEERIKLSMFPFVVGRNKQMCNYCIEDDPFIGRAHFIVKKSGVSFFIQDNNSLNGTILDGIRLNPEKEYELHTGSVIQISNEKFRFYSSTGTL